MVKVAICDDEIAVGAQLERYVINIFNGQHIKYDIDVFLTGDELCEKIKVNFCYDLIFLDIEFAKHQTNGVEVGRRIRDAYENNIVSIVYISWEKKYAMELFEIRPLNFIVKPIEYEKIEQTIKTYLKNFETVS